MAVKKRRETGGRVWVAVAVVLVIVVVVVAVGVYGGSLGLPGFSHSGSSSTSGNLFTVANVTLSTLPSIEDGQVGIGASASIVNHSTVKISNATILVSGVDLGTCLTTVQPGQTSDCKVGQSVVCANIPSSPYAVKVTVYYADGVRQSSTTTITNTLTYVGC